MSSIIHKERKHSKFSASGAERWMACPGSVALSEGLPDKSNKWAEEGTKAHEMLETVLNAYLTNKPLKFNELNLEMFGHVNSSAQFLFGLHRSILNAELLVETRIHLDFIHPEMFGTFDSAIVDHFGVLHVFDFKYGAGHGVSPKDNLQMIFYGLGLAYKYDWNFSSVRLWIIQPRIPSFDGPVFWDVSIGRLRSYVSVFKKAVDRVEAHPNEYAEGTWCHWCRAKNICPLKKNTKIEKAISVFSKTPIERQVN